MIKNIRKIAILLAVIVVLVLIAVLILKVGSKEDNENQDLSSSNTFQITDFNIQNRTVLKKANAIYVGNNTKELEKVEGNSLYLITIEDCMMKNISENRKKVLKIRLIHSIQKALNDAKAENNVRAGFQPALHT